MFSQTFYNVISLQSHISVFFGVTQLRFCRASNLFSFDNSFLARVKLQFNLILCVLFISEGIVCVYNNFLLNKLTTMNLGIALIAGHFILLTFLQLQLYCGLEFCQVFNGHLILFRQLHSEY